MDRVIVTLQPPDMDVNTPERLMRPSPAVQLTHIVHMCLEINS